MAEKVENINKIFNLLKSGDKNIQLSNGKDVVLLLGNTGAGKTTLTQFIAGGIGNLEAVEVLKDSGEFVIVDKDSKISYNSTTMSKTIFPDLFFRNETQTYFYDCPGFSDTRDAAHDISTTYFIRKVIKSSNAVKMIFVVNYPSVRKGVDRNDFMRLVRHASSFLKDVEKYKNSIALIVTKVDNTYVHKKGKIHLVPDEKVKEAIGEFLMSVVNDIKNHYMTANIKEKEKAKLKNGIKFIEILLEKKNNHFQRLGIFRRPNEPGALNNSFLMQEGKLILDDLIFNHLIYTSKDDNDFGYTISAESINYVHDLSDEINKSIGDKIKKMGLKIQLLMEEDEKTTFDIYENYNKFTSTANIFLKYQEDEMRRSNSVLDFLLSDLLTLNRKIHDEHKSDIVDNYNYLMFLESISGKTTKNPMIWTDGLLSTIKYLKNNMDWYRFLENLSYMVSDYAVQANLSEFNATDIISYIPVVEDKDVKMSDIGLKQFLQIIKSKNPEYNTEGIFNDMKDIPVGSYKLGVLKKILEESLIEKDEMKCQRGNEIEVRGEFIKLSHVRMDLCPKSPVSLKIFASKKIFIDDDLKTDDLFQMAIISPIWDIIGDRQIVLDGKLGVSLNYPALDGYNSDGVNGASGGRGGDAGDFIGIALQVIGNRLRISANGGRGGKGQDGGKGADGLKGTDGSRAPSGETRTVFDEWGPEDNWDYERIPWQSMGSVNRLFVAWYYYKTYGTKATDGGDGGDGGAGGRGGYGGDVMAIDFSNSSKISISNSNGIGGLPGNGGAPGHRALNGRDRMTECRYIRPILLSFTSCGKTWTIDMGYSKAGSQGKRGLEPIELPYKKPFVNNEPMISIAEYKEFMETKMADSTQRSFQMGFLDLINKKFGISDGGSNSSSLNQRKRRGIEHVELKNQDLSKESGYAAGNTFIHGDSIDGNNLPSHTNEAMLNSLLSISNLALWDLLGKVFLRTRKHNSNSNISYRKFQDSNESEYSHTLAYSHYVPNN